jgi:hypothetical protein
LTIAEKLLIACLREEDQKTLSKIKGVWTDTKEFKQFRYVVDYLKDHGVLPGLNEYIDIYKHDPLLADAKPKYYLAELKKRFIYNGIAEELPGIIRNARKDPLKALSDLKIAIGNLDTADHDSKDIRYSDDTDDRLAEYEKKRVTRGVTHLSTGSEILDKYWFGYKKAHYLINSTGGICVA